MEGTECATRPILGWMGANFTVKEVAHAESTEPLVKDWQSVAVVTSMVKKLIPLHISHAIVLPLQRF